MRHITKGVADSDLQAEHKRPPATKNKAQQRWEAFRKRKKRQHYVATRKLCLELEQFGLCGYSEVNLVNGYGITKELGIHLEHIEPKSKNHARTFDHSNLIACAIDDSNKRGIAKHDVFGGHFRGDWFVQNAFLHPLVVDCQKHFYFELSTGRVVPNQTLPRREQAKARLTIFKLNLNSPVLVQWRFDYLTSVRNNIVKLLQSDPQKLPEYAKKVLLPDANSGLLKPFHSVSCQLFGSLSLEIKQSANLS